MTPSITEKALRECRVNTVQPIIFAVSGPDAGGIFLAKQWVVVTEDRLMVLHVNNGSSAIRHDLLLKDIRSPRLIARVGSGALTVTVFDKPVELIRYSQGKSKGFSAVAKYLSDRSNGTPRQAVAQEESKPAASDKNVTAARIAVLRRLLHYLKPFRLSATVMSLMILAGTGVGLITPYFTTPAGGSRAGAGPCRNRNARAVGDPDAHRRRDVGMPIADARHQHRAGPGRVAVYSSAGHE